MYRKLEKKEVNINFKRRNLKVKNVLTVFRERHDLQDLPEACENLQQRECNIYYTSTNDASNGATVTSFDESWSEYFVARVGGDVNRVCS